MSDLSTWMSQAESLRAAGKLAEAEALYRQVLAQDPAHAAAWYGLAKMGMATGRFELAAGLLSKAIKSTPNDPALYVDLGVCFDGMSRFDLAIQAHRQALRIAPGHPVALTNLGTDLRNLHQIEESIACLREGIRLHPEFVELHCSLALSLLMAGKLSEGWREFEWRLQSAGWRQQSMAEIDPELQNIPRWQGEPLPGQSLLLQAEQGAGDCIQFLRYAPLARERVGRLVLVCRDNLVSLAKTSEGIDEVVPKSQGLPRCDRYAMMMSLPHLLGGPADQVPARVPYLQAPVGNAPAEAGQGELRVGLVWAGNPKHINDANRSVSLAKLAPLLATPQTRFYSLQVGPQTAELSALPSTTVVTDYSKRLADFADTAAVIMELDLLITVDTSVAHLAGALGRPVWLLVPFVPDWRWQLRGRTSVWYPTMRLFRQPSPGNWEAVVAEAVQALHEYRR